MLLRSLLRNLHRFRFHDDGSRINLMRTRGRCTGSSRCSSCFLISSRLKRLRRRSTLTTFTRIRDCLCGWIFHQVFFVRRRYFCIDVVFFAAFHFFRD